MHLDSEDTLSERNELHFLAAIIDELMRKLQQTGLLSQADLNAIEQEVSKRTGQAPRAW